MILNEAEEVVESVNFQTVVYHHSQLNLKIFLNRVRMYMNKQKVSRLMVADFLPIGYKIVKE